MRRTLLSPGAGPQTADTALSGAKLVALFRAGFAEEATSLAQLAGVASGDPHGGQVHVMGDLLRGDDTSACRRGADLVRGRETTFWLKLRAYCYVAAGEPAAGELTLGLLRDQGVLSDTEDALLTALVAGVAPKTPPSPRTVLEYAAARRLGLPLTAGFLAEADLAVIEAAAADKSAELETRIWAAETAVAAGAMSVRDLAGLFQDFDFSLDAIAQAAATVRENPGALANDALAFQAAYEMRAPEFLPRKTRLIADALRAADGFERSYALSRLYAPLIKTIDPTRNDLYAAPVFARALLAAGETTAAAGWIATLMPSDDPVTSGYPADALAGLELLDQLSLLDPLGAAGLAAAAGVQPPAAASRLSLPAGAGGAANAQAEMDRVSRIVESAFDAAIGKKEGQAALAALAAAGATSPETAALRAVIVTQSLKLAGFEGELGRLSFEAAWAEAMGAGEESFAPRIKPARN